MQLNNAFDPKEKNENTQESLQRQENEEGLHLVNDDGTVFDDSERTYVSVDLPEEAESADDSGE